MDYLKLLKNLKKEFLESGRARYQKLNIVLRIIFTIIFIPLRVAFAIARFFYWFTWFFFKAIAAPVDYLTAWLEKQKENLGDIAKAALVLVCMPFIFIQHIILAFNTFSFFFQWFGLMIQAFVLTLGAVRWQPVITEAKFDEE